MGACMYILYVLNAADACLLAANLSLMSCYATATSSSRVSRSNYRRANAEALIIYYCAMEDSAMRGESRIPNIYVRTRPKRLVALRDANKSSRLAQD